MRVADCVGAGGFGDGLLAEGLRLMVHDQRCRLPRRAAAQPAARAPQVDEAELQYDEVVGPDHLQRQRGHEGRLRELREQAGIASMGRADAAAR